MKRNARHTATISLAIMGAGFAAAFPIAHLPYGYVLQSGFEAGLVGGLADWFAVTALFRHPLGIPIPHTALLPRNRNKVTNALVNAIERNLLNKDSIIEKMKSARVADRIAEKLKDKLAEETAGEETAALLGKVLAAVPPEQAAAALAPAVRHAVRSLDSSAVLDRLGRELLDRKLEEPLFDYLLLQGERFAANADMRHRLGAMAMRSIEKLQLGGFMGFAVNAFAGFMNEDKLGGMLQEFLMTMLNDMRKPGNSYRETALAAMRDMVSGLGANERVLEEIERLKARLLDDDGEKALIALLAQAINSLTQRWSNPEYCRDVIIPKLRSGIRYVTEQTDWVRRADEWIQHQAAAFVERNHGAIGKLVKENADKLDNDSLIAMMEEHVGKDLQWIRVNGAVCGFAIGIVLGLLQWFAVGG